MNSQVGVGTTITFTLDCPEVVASIIPPVKKQNDRSLVTLEKELKILLVEDSEVNRTLIHAFLSKTKCKIVDAENGKIAVEKVKNEKFDIILMDIQMPVMDGYEATKEIRLWEKGQNHAHTPIIALSAYAQKEEQEKSIAAGCDKHLNKPIVKKDLLNVLNAM